MMTLSVRTAFLIFNFLGLQITWAACAYGATHSIPNLGVLIGVTYIVLHMLFTPTRKQDILLMCGISIIGICIDHINTYLGLSSFAEQSTTHSAIPFWLITLWLVFSLMIPHSLNWLGKNTMLAFFLGGLGGSSSYWLGHKLGALTLSEPLSLSIAIHFIEWAILFPAAYYLLKLIRQKFSMNSFNSTHSINN